MTFSGTFSDFPVAPFAEIMGDAVIVKSCQDVVLGWFVCAMTEDTIVFLEIF